MGRLSHQTIRTVDVVVAVWVVICILVGVFVARRVNELGSLGDGLVNVGNAISDTAVGLSEVADIPLVGGGLQAVVEQIEGIGRSAAEKGEEGKSAVLRLAAGIGLLFALVGVVPVLVVWLPLRLWWQHDRRQVSRALESDRDGMYAYLAHRAVATYPYQRLVEVSADPWSDLREGRYRDLAGLELARLGLSAGTAAEPA